jgi:alanyl-tRNA synthetase
MASKSNLEWSARKIRQSFLDYFRERDHTIVPSASLVPGNDPTLLFTNAGMVQFKDVFLGTGTRPYSRVADSQKCMRVAGKHNDLDDVGRDDTHHTFFEMLGNWSFGDYYKKEAITWAWDLLTGVWGLPKNRFWATCFEDEQGEIPKDTEAADYWFQQPGFIHDQLVFFGREENFWEMADTGPCGPDSEIHFDRGEEYCDKKDLPGHQCQVNGDCSRFLELWNLVFIQYNRLSPTHLEPLPNKHIDTGLGLERIVSVLQDVDSNYETDLFIPMLAKTQALAGHSGEERERWITPYRVIADHSRAAAFLIGDGVVPGNTGRNYICRMVIRRASRFGNQLGFSEPFLAKIAAVVIEEYGDVYPELVRNQSVILKTITDEERRFRRTVDTGVSHLEELLGKLQEEGKEVLLGEEAFDLYATYGLPLEISRDIARETGFEIDEAGFLEAMETHRQTSGAGQQIGTIQEREVRVYQHLLKSLQDSGDLDAGGVEYDPYSQLQVNTKVLGMIQKGAPIDQASPGDQIEIVLQKTPYYVEAGGQVSDTGNIVSGVEPTWEIQIEDTRQPIDKLILHTGRVVSGSPRVGEGAVALVDPSRRWDIMRNHTATHLLHAALRKVLGEHARQAGSLVAPDRLRFDFTHPEALSGEEIGRVERYVNEAILADFDLHVNFKNHEEAVKEGAVALFGETYEEEVRTIAIGDEDWLSYELCGGTHVPQTGVIGPFLILSEGSVAAGIRRIEAVTGRAAMEKIYKDRSILQQAASLLESNVDRIVNQIQMLEQERDTLKDELDQLHTQEANTHLQALETLDIEGIRVVRGIIPDVEIEILRELTDRFRNDYDSGIALLASVKEGKPLIVAAVTKNLVDQGFNASELVRTVASEVGGGGGGRPTFAQAGGKYADKLPEAIGMVEDWVRSRLR